MANLLGRAIRSTFVENWLRKFRRNSLILCMVALATNSQDVLHTHSHYFKTARFCTERFRVLAIILHIPLSKQHNKVRFLCIRGTMGRDIPQLRWGATFRSSHGEKETKCNLRIISDINIFQLLASQRSVSANHPASSWQKI